MGVDPSGHGRSRRSARSSRAAVRSRGAVVAILLLALLVPSTAQARTVIDTTGSWDGSLEVCNLGRPDTATYGQVVTVPATDTALEGFSFYLKTNVGSPTLVVRAEVYAWDGTKATGPNLWESSPRSVLLDVPFQEVPFVTGGVSLVSGHQYVLLASVSKDYEQNADPALGCWGLYGPHLFWEVNSYSGGGFVFENNGGDESQWTSEPWQTLGNGMSDLAFKAIFGASVADLDEPVQEWELVAVRSLQEPG